MIKKNLKVLIITSLIILLPIAVGLLLWGRLPDQIPIHWNAKGEIDGWCGKGFFVFAFPCLLLGGQWLCVLATMTDPKKEEHTRKILQLVFWIIPALSLLLNGISYFAAIGMEIPIEIITPILLGILLAIIGNYMPKCKQNFTIGIKCPWTLSSEENWNKTHRFAGRIWMISGIALAILGFFNIGWIYLLFLIPPVLAPIIYSYLLYKKGI